MTMPPRYEESYGTNKVCKLTRALYRLKQSPKTWFGKFTKTMKMLRYKQCNGDHTLFFKHFQTGEAIKLEEQLTTHFEVKNWEL